MPGLPIDVSLPARSPVWKWWVCALLLLATTINYMDRLTLNQAASHIKKELELNNQQYGDIELGFGVAFALGALVMGRTADWLNVRWLFPVALLSWSAAGFLTGFARNLEQLIICRVALGFFESGLWPCALRTTQRILRPAERTLGNALLQSGAALGSVVTPLIVLALVRGPGTWSYPFFVIGAVGTSWAILWLLSVNSDDLSVPTGKDTSIPATGDMFSRTAIPRLTAILAREFQWLWQMARRRRFWVLVAIVIAINLTWHFFRVWLPLFLKEHHDYSDSAVQGFSTAYYTAADAGSLTGGFMALWLAQRGWAVHASRVAVYAACSNLALLSFAVAYVEPGPVLFALLMLLGFGALGVFPVYYSFSQELTVKDQGRLTGTLSFTTWMASAAMHPIVGGWLDRTKDWPSALALAGLPPFLGLIVLILFWGRTTMASIPADLDLSRPNESAAPDEHIREPADKIKS
jgi:ACS family hexuronate transporter-like MFS transporter